MAESEEPQKTQVILRLTINLDAPLGMLQRAIGRMVDLVSFGLFARNEATLTEVPELPDVFPQLRIGKGLAPEELKAEFGNWVLGNGLRDMIEALEPYFDEIWKICSALTIGPGGPRRREEVDEILQALEQAQEEFPDHISAKLRHILDTQPTLLENEWKKSLFSIIALRNCLVHRRGIVGARDCDRTGALTIKWRDFEPRIQYEDGSVQPLFKGMVTQQAGEVQLKMSWKELAIEEGQVARFSTRDFSEIAFTLWFAALHMRSRFLELLKSAGVEVEVREQPEQSEGPEAGVSPQ